MPDGTLGPSFDFTAIFAGLMASVGLGLLFAYVFFGIVLTILAGQTRTPGAGLAWVPIANMYLLCKIGRRSGAWVLLLFVPLVNFFAIAVLWASVAGARGKPSWTGPLVLLPPFTLLTPIYLMLGKQRTPAPGAALPPCPTCRTPIGPGERFCGECGRPLPMTPAWSSLSPGISAGKAMGVALVMLILIVGVDGLIGWHFFGRSMTYEAPTARQAPAVPENLAGTMIEFPIDTDPTAPAKADSVITQDFRAPAQNGVREDPKVPADWLPPGIDRTSLSQQTSTMTSATYDIGGDSPDDASSPDVVPAIPTATADSNPVYVHVLASSGNADQQADSYARSVAEKTQGQRTPIEVRSPLGQVYRGSRIRTQQVTVYVLTRQRSSVVTLLYAPQPSGAAIADRLARNLGNGHGPQAFLGGRTLLSILPANPPDGLRLQEINATTPQRMGLTAANMNSTLNASQDPALEQKLAQFRSYLPRRLMYARYADPSRNDYDTIVLDYGTTRAAYNLWFLFRWTVGARQFQTTPILGTDGRYTADNDSNYLLFQKGPYLVIMHSPKATPSERLFRLANGLQM